VETSTKKRWMVVGTALACACFATLFVRSWIRESSNGEYFMTVLWGVAVALFLTLLVFRIRVKD